jgi:hypothetical protein
MNKVFLIFLALIFLGPGVARPQERDIDQRREFFEELTRGMTKGQILELRTLEIRARIHEPHVIYVLDRSRPEVTFKEREVQFSPRILTPIVDNQF